MEQENVLMQRAAVVGSWGQAVCASISSAEREEPPILIVGCGHSGTSVLLAILGAHSKLHAIARETGFADPKLDQRPTAEIVRSVNRQFGKANHPGQELRWVEKTRAISIIFPASSSSIRNAGCCLSFATARRGLFDSRSHREPRARHPALGGR